MKQKQLRRKTIIVTLVFLAVGGILFKSIFTTSMQIYEKKKEQKEYTVKLEKLKDKEDELNNTVTKLQDPDYVARYAREKYLYSKDGEIVVILDSEKAEAENTNIVDNSRLFTGIGVFALAITSIFIFILRKKRNKKAPK